MHWCKQHHGNIHSWTMSSPPWVWEIQVTWEFHMEGCHHSCAPYHGGGVGNGGPESCTHNVCIYIYIYISHRYVFIYTVHFLIIIYLHISIYYFRGMVAMLLFSCGLTSFGGLQKSQRSVWWRRFCSSKLLSEVTWAKATQDAWWPLGGCIILTLGVQ